MKRMIQRPWSGAGVLSFMATLLILTACQGSGDTDRSSRHASGSQGAYEELVYGEAFCEFEGERIETVRYGGRITLDSGETLDFMSVECLVGYYVGMEDPARATRLQVTDFTHGKRLMDVNEMVYLYSRLRPSPNGMFLSAIEASDEKMRTYIYDAYPGPMLSWEEVLTLVAEEWNLDLPPALAGRVR